MRDKIRIKIKAFWLLLTGSEEEFSLENRLYHNFSLIALLVLAYHVPFNYFVGLYFSSVIAFVMLLIQFGMYYLARFKGKLSLSILITGITTYALLALNYITNSGISGPTLLSFAAVFFLIISVSPPKHYIWWLFANLGVVTGLLLFEYLNLDFVQHTYESREERFIDITSAYTVVVGLIFSGTLVLVKSYRKEKKSSELKALELERINAEKNRLFSIISHDLRSPLSSIQSYLQLLNETDLDEPERKELQQALIKNTAGTQDMLTNLLAWAQTQMNGVRVNLKPVNISEVLRSTISLTAQLAEKKSILLFSNLPADLIVRADADMLELIVRNLLSNAVKFTAANGTVQIEASRAGSLAIIKVSDNGLGIDWEKQKNIFSSQVNPAYGTGREKGVGLGLVLCKEFTELQGGRISFKSEPGKGSVFEISLPLRYTDNA